MAAFFDGFLERKPAKELLVQAGLALLTRARPVYENFRPPFLKGGGVAARPAGRKTLFSFRRIFGSFLQEKKEHPQGRFSGGKTAPAFHLLEGSKFSPEKAAQNLPNAVICVKIALKRS
ncbi:hypothetical protein [uncultured Anaerotruncus sp.]|uniref:hypothetical protein n=1 Tax=uncultured Anaerotruncus sp. TaxID=905011 RepID=UPI00280A8470|nr:hypothetical protein [uncultured Anaerotruncus sp.]